MGKPRGNALPDFVPRNCLGPTAIEIGDASRDLVIPGTLSTLVCDCFKTFYERADQGGALRLRKCERHFEQL